jgi:hypothetical protein
MNGTANNYLAGSLGIGSTSVGNGINLNMEMILTADMILEKKWHLMHRMITTID